MDIDKLLNENFLRHRLHSQGKGIKLDITADAPIEREVNAEGSPAGGADCRRLKWPFCPPIIRSYCLDRTLGLAMIENSLLLLNRSFRLSTQLASVLIRNKASVNTEWLLFMSILKDDGKLFQPARVLFPAARQED
jgi:hypothetical protein